MCTVVAGLALGGGIYSVQALLLFAALTRLSAGLVGLVLYIYPTLVMAAAVMLGHERPTRRTMLAFLLAEVGVIFVLWSRRSSHVDVVGVLLALGSAIVYAGYVMATDTLVERVQPLALANLVRTEAACTCTASVLLTGQLQPMVQPAGWIALVILALVSTVGAIGLFLSGVSRVGPSTARILSMVESLVTVALAYLVVGERILPLQGAGGAFILGAVLVVQGWQRVPVRPTVANSVATSPTHTRASTADRDRVSPRRTGHPHQGPTPAGKRDIKTEKTESSTRIRPLSGSACLSLRQGFVDARRTVTGCASSRRHTVKRCEPCLHAQGGRAAGDPARMITLV